MKARIGVLIFAMSLGGCATQYQKQGLTGGFDETQLAPNMYRVSFNGNGYTSVERAANLALLRCADLTLQNGYSYFAVVDAKEGTTQSAYTTPTQSYTTGSVSVTGNTYGGTANAYGQARTTTYGGQTFIISSPSASNTIVMVKSQSEFPGTTYDAAFIYGSLGKKYEIDKK